jgi:DNA-binding response OmpR family regulator
VKRILVVEDDLDIAALERDFLEAEGYESIVAASGTEAIDVIGHHRFDLVILDLMLPGNDGFEVCRAIRARGHTPVIVVSARTADLDKVRALGIGADDYVEKPFSPTELVARVKAHIRRSELYAGSAPSHSVIAVGQLEIDTDRRAVSVRGGAVSVTSTEYELLTLLARHPNRLFSRDELFERIWGDVYGDASTVTVHIRRLREKIERDASHPEIIETVWGMGYRLNA